MYTTRKANQLISDSEYMIERLKQKLKQPCLKFTQVNTIKSQIENRKTMIEKLKIYASSHQATTVAGKADAQ